MDSLLNTEEYELRASKARFLYFFKELRDTFYHTDIDKVMENNRKNQNNQNNQSPSSKP